VAAIFIPNLPGHSSLLHPAASSRERLPAVRQRRPDGIQLLPSLQLQTDAAARFMLSTGSLGNVTTPTLEALTEAEYSKIIAWVALI
jgi:hypothetical protein